MTVCSLRRFAGIDLDVIQKELIASKAPQAKDFTNIYLSRQRLLAQVRP